MACCSSDGNISLISDSTWGNEFLFKASNSAINSVCLSPIKLSKYEKNCVKNDIFLISGGHDKIIRIWTVSKMFNETSLIYEIDNMNSNMVRDVKFSPDVLENIYTIGSCSEDGNIKIFNMIVEDKDNIRVNTVFEKNVGFSIWKLSWNTTGRIISGVYLKDNKFGTSIDILKKNLDNWEAI